MRAVMIEQLAEVRSYDELVLALRDRVSKLGVTCESIDYVAGLPQRYTNKLLSGPVPVRTFGRRSLGPVLQSLGLKLVLCLDDESDFEKLKQRLSPVRHPGNGMQATQRPPRRRFFFQEPGAAVLARAHQLVTQSKRRRRAIARRAAKLRWAKRRNGVAAQRDGV
jgi:hypothetical protein